MPEPEPRPVLSQALFLVIMAGVLLFAFALCGTLSWESRPARIAAALCASALFAALCAGVVYVRTSIRSFTRSMGQILESVGMGAFRSARVDRADELHALLSQLNEAVEKQRTIDRLRARRVGLAFRLVRLLHLRMNTPAILVDLHTGGFDLNGPFCTLYDTEHDTVSADAVLNMSANAEFSDLYDRALFTSGRPEASEVELSLPHGRTHRLRLEVIPVRGEDDTVARALILALDHDEQTADAPLADEKSDDPA